MQQFSILASNISVTYRNRGQPAWETDIQYADGAVVARWLLLLQHRDQKKKKEKKRVP